MSRCTHDAWLELYREPRAEDDVSHNDRQAMLRDFVGLAWGATIYGRIAADDNLCCAGRWVERALRKSGSIVLDKGREKNRQMTYLE